MIIMNEGSRHDNEQAIQAGTVTSKCSNHTPVRKCLHSHCATYPDCVWPPLVTSSWDRVIDELEAEIENPIDRAPMSDL